MGVGSGFVSLRLKCCGSQLNASFGVAGRREVQLHLGALSDLSSAWLESSGCCCTARPALMAVFQPEQPALYSAAAARVTSPAFRPIPRRSSAVGEAFAVSGQDTRSVSGI